MFEHTAHLAVLPFTQRHRDPRVAALPAFEAGADRAIGDAVNRDAFPKHREAFRRDLAVDSHFVAADPSGRWQFEPSRERAVIGQQQQPLGIEIEASDRDQPRQFFRQRVEYRRPALLVAMRRDESGRLVIAPQARPVRGGQRLAVDTDAVLGSDHHCRCGQHLTIDRDPTRCDPALGIAARAHAGARQYFRNPLRTLLAHSPAAAIKARKIRRSASLISNSGCHCTPRQKR